MLVSTGEVSSITTTSADVSGLVIDLGEGANQHGHCYGTSPNLTISTGSKKELGNPPKGGFTSQLTNLTAETKYYVKAFMSNGTETVYGDEISFSTQAPVIPTISTTSVTGITTITAISGGIITDDGESLITMRGVCWNTTIAPSIANSKTTDGTSTGSFISNINGLAPSTTYYVRAYATNSIGTAYGNEVSFTTNAPPATIPSLSTNTVTGITENSGSSGGNITSDGGASITARGVCWSSTLNPVVTGSHTSDGATTGIFSSSITGLLASTKYYVRAYATNSVGTAYGNEIYFTTNAPPAMPPTLSTSIVSAITETTASSGGNITSNGGAELTSSGVCWGTSTNPDISGNHTTDGITLGLFSSSLTGLIPNTKYYIRAYATNSAGTTYGNELIFTTIAIPIVVPALSTTEISIITETTALGGGNITSDGGAAIIARGVCWSTTTSPVASGNHTTDGTTTGIFTSSISGLTASTIYYVRAYATNSAGTAYGNEVSFTTLAGLPVLSTKSITEISAMGCITGGIIISAGGGTISAKGICWSELPNPAISDNMMNSGTGTSSFNASITSATPNTFYYVRAFATNESGTSYGDQKTFTSLNAVFYGFESGLMPVGFTGQWYLANTGINSSYSIRSLYALPSTLTTTSTYTSAGVLRFSYKFSDYGCGATSIYPTIKLLIDDVELNTYSGDANQNWLDAAVNVTAGTHVFKWVFTQGHYIGDPFCGNGADMGTGYVDNIYLIY